MTLLRNFSLFLFSTFFAFSLFAQDTSTGWVKYENNPVLGGAELGTCFDISMIQEDGVFKMWFSWRPKKSIAYTESKDGVTWKEPVIVLSPANNDWENDLNRPSVLKRDGVYHLWYTGQAKGKSWIGYATSNDGLTWKRQSDKPVLSAEAVWEKVAVMCPHVEWDADVKLYKMWYSGGEQYEPNAIGYAISPDGLTWTKYPQNPVFAADKEITWEHHKVTAAQIIKRGDWYFMFYIGFEHENLAHIGIARSKDGITNWERLPTNPIIGPGKGTWDEIACYKPFAIYDTAEKKWRLWYNGRNNKFERIGLVTHDGEDLGFPENVPQVSPLPKAHAHNDYAHKRPLFDALDNGFCSVEADIFLVDGELLVGHTRIELKPERTLDALYLKPLLERCRKNGGKVYPDAPFFYLWIDLKTNGNEIYPKLQELLSKYDEMLTSFDGETKNSKAIQIIITGGTPRQLIIQEKGRRYMTFDGRPNESSDAISPDLMPAVSDKWSAHFKWDGTGTMPEDQKKILDKQLREAHQAGRKVRYWATPQNVSFWKFADETGIDFINTDYLEKLKSFFTEGVKKSNDP
ncbi:MAG: family 43 glycosylhydrolase [Planctomycetaceae bacterium]|jgi:predicted GH43/DUF377 family glycosyl hydrolase|nr:family 43 glycosylhydrolase [Planctomycetaceae bacterium]